MTILARGSLADRPWGMTVGALGTRGLTGQVTLSADGKAFRVAFSQGIIVAAQSPLASDAAVRLALTSNLISSTQVSDITRRMAASPDREELELLGELARLQPDQVARMRRRLVAQRAARTFSPDRGDFIIEDYVTIPVIPGGELDVRTVVYLGAKTNMSEDRLTFELGQLGAYFELKPEAMEDLPQFGFTAAEKPVLDMLVDGAYVDEIEIKHPAIGPRVVRAILYALASCGACVLGAPPRSPRALTPSSSPTLQPSRTKTPIPYSPEQPRTVTPPTVPPPSQPRTRTPSMVQMARTSTGSSIAMPRTSTGNSVPRPVATAPSGGVPRAVEPSASGGIPREAQRVGSSGSTRPRTPSAPPQPDTRKAAASATHRSRRDSSAVNEIEQLLALKVPMLDSGVDHFTLLGLSTDASAADVRSAYFTLARKLHPDRLSAIGVDDVERRAQRLMAQVNLAFAVLNDAVKREQYSSIMLRGGEAAVRAEEAKADELAMRVMRAEEAFKQGEMALRREQLPQAIEAFKMAVELQPRESEYQAMLAWAQFASAPDKKAVADATRKALVRAHDENSRSPTAKYYLGRVERMMGREREALQCFNDVLAIKPSHSEAASEARILQQRLNKR